MVNFVENYISLKFLKIRHFMIPKKLFLSNLSPSSKVFINFLKIVLVFLSRIWRQSFTKIITTRFIFFKYDFKFFRKNNHSNLVLVKARKDDESTESKIKNKKSELDDLRERLARTEEALQKLVIATEQVRFIKF